MELALPLIALGGLYVVSNQTNNNTTETKKSIRKMTQETFTNMGGKKNYLPNTDILPQNYPVMNNKQLADTVQEYVNPNTATDKYFDQNYYQKQENMGVNVGNTPQQIYSLSGNYLNNNTFKHNNMIPFDGGKIKGYTYDTQIAENVLDNMVGNGSQTIKKIEQAPLFKPEDNVNWTYGTPNQSDFYQSRVNPGLKNNNVKPFESEYVGPGLNQGYGKSGSGGFNSGMESRDQWMPKTVDQLRVDTNPKMEYELTNHQGPSYSHVQNVGIIGVVEKQRPDTYFVNSSDRWLTTTGAEKAGSLRPEQEMGIIRRTNCDVNYSGPAGSDRHAGYAPTSFEESKRNKTETCAVNPASAQRRGPSTDLENVLRSHTNYNNHRSTIRQPDTIRSGFSGAIGAVIAPLMDVLRPSRKEEVVSNIRVYGEMQGHAVSSSYVSNPLDVTNTTIKETTMYSPKFNINNQKDGTYINNYNTPDETHRDTTNCSYIGGMGNNYEGPRDYTSGYNQHNNDIKAQTIYNRTNQGGTQQFNSQMNISISKPEPICSDPRQYIPNSIVKLPASKEQYGNFVTPSQNNMSIETQRNTPDILNAFRSNPYTHSLNTAV